MKTAVEWYNQQIVDRQNGNGDSRSRDEIFEKAKETQKLTMINALVEFSKAHFDIHTEEAILNITRRAEKYYNQTFKQQEQ
jgi:hypothetical protein